MDKKMYSPGLKTALEFPLVEALFGRRARRFSLGASIPDGPLAFASRHEPMPLSELEQMMVLTAAAGNTGWHHMIYRHARYAPHLSNYSAAAGGSRKRRDASPPSFNPQAGCYPALYRGNCIKYDLNLNNADIKVWNGRDWVWVRVPIKSKRNRHLLAGSFQLSPQLIVNNKSVYLSVPFRLIPEKLEGDKVCAVDLGINTLATVSIVTSSGTVTARKFFHPAADIDRRDKHGKIVSRQARLTKKLHRGFAKDNYRKARQINVNIAHQISRKIVDFATGNGASVIVFEQLKGWRPTGGRKRSNLRQRFHGWLHRRLGLLTEQKFEEVGGKTEFVYARGTSSWAYDGSGRVKRSQSNYSVCTFANGKQYNADLSATYNIAARYIPYKLKLTRRNDGQLSGGKSSERQAENACYSVSIMG